MEETRVRVVEGWKNEDWILGNKYDLGARGNPAIQKIRNTQTNRRTRRV